MDQLEKHTNIKKIHEPIPPAMNWIAKLTKMNHIIEVMAMYHEPTGLNKIKKLTDNKYINLETKEIKEYKTSEHRGHSIESTKRTLKRLRHLINNNFHGEPNELFVTLTYKENMTDTKQLYNDFKIFIKRLKRKYPDVEYLSVVEPQGRGAWHCHVLIKFTNRESIYINNNNILAPMWGHGFTKITNISEVDNIGAYLTAYLSDLEITDENRETLIDNIGNHTSVIDKEITENGQTISKRYLKGGRLKMYPPGMNIYRYSRGIIKPDTEKMTYMETKEYVGKEQPHYIKQVAITVDDLAVNTITYEQYNMKRIKEDDGDDKTNKPIPM
ncbi:MAG: hypothetical protein FWE90_08240 [Defluviitaleaceae bacterium]|nr:hypothetical protein [Defluviitaleaceae bacterium]